MRYIIFLFFGLQSLAAQDVHIRINIVGYLPEDNKVAFIMAKDPIKGKAELVDAQSGERIFSIKIKPVKGQKWGQFQHQYLFDFSKIARAGNYFVQVGETSSAAFAIGIPFLWCSNNLTVNFITQVMLYEKMTGDQQYHAAMLLHRDWLLGRNPWGTSMFSGIPAKGETPMAIHVPPYALLGESPAGGLVDGPIYQTIHKNLMGLVLTEADELAAFQNDFVVYHDDIGDYATNEPTMDGTADAILMMALWTQ